MLIVASHHLEDLKNSRLTDETIGALGFHSVLDRLIPEEVPA